MVGQLTEMDDEMRNSKCQCIQNLLSTNVPAFPLSKCRRSHALQVPAPPHHSAWGLVKQTKKPLTMLFSALVTIVFGLCFLQIQRLPIRSLLKNPATWIENVHLLRFFHAFGKFPETKPPPRQVPKKSLWYDPAPVQGNATSEAPSWASKAAENFPWWDTPLASNLPLQQSSETQVEGIGWCDDGWIRKNHVFFCWQKFQQSLELAHFF